MKTVRRSAGRAVGFVTGAILLTGLPPVRLSAQDSFPTRPPRPAPLRPAQFPPFQEAALPNGMTLVVVENHEQPVLSVSLSFRAGSVHDPAGKEGLAGLVAEVLTKGSGSRSAEQIAAAIEGAGGNLGAGAGDDFLTISTDVLSDHADLAFDLLGEVARRATFPADELELARTRSLSALALELSQPASVAELVFAREIYGRHPYGTHPSTESIKAITRNDLTQFAARRLRPAGALLVMSGDVTLAGAQSLARRAFGGWSGAPPADAAPVPAPPVKPATDILLVHRPGSVQSNIVVGNTTFAPTDPGYYPARIAMQVLGGGADARLFLILREQKSWTYGSFARLDRKRGVGAWEATFEGRTEVTDSALTEMLRQVDRIRTEAISDSELQNAKNFLVGSFPLTVETPQQIANVVTTSKLLGLGPDYLRLYRERLAAVTPLAARAAAARTIKRGALTIVVVGDGEKIYDKLKLLAPVRIVDVDGKPMRPEDLHPHTGPVALDRAQLVTGTDSFRVVIQGNPMGYIVTRRTVGPDSAVYLERTVIGPVFQQTTSVVLDAPGFGMRRVDQTGVVQALKPETHLTYGGGRVKGRASTPQRDGTLKAIDIDTAVAAGTWDDNALNLILPALPLANGATIPLSVLSSGEGVTKVMTVKVSGPDTLTVPAGTFRAWRLQIAGGQAPLVVYVSTETPRRVLKTEVVGAPFTVELVK